MRAPQRTSAARPALVSPAVLAAVALAVVAGWPADPARAQDELPSVLVNPAFATPGAVPWGYGATQPGAVVLPPTVGMPLQLPPAGMPRSRLTLPPGMVPPAAAVGGRGPAWGGAPAPSTAITPPRVVSSPAPQASNVQETVRATEQAATAQPPATGAPSLARRPEPPAASVVPEGPAPSPPSPAQVTRDMVAMGAPPPEPDVPTGSTPEPLTERAAPSDVPLDTAASTPDTGQAPELASSVATDPAPMPVASPAPEPQIAMVVPPIATLAATPKPPAPPRAAADPGPPGVPTGRTRLAAGTTLLMAGTDGRIGPMPPPMTLPGAPISRPPNDPPSDRPSDPPAAPSAAEAEQPDDVVEAPVPEAAQTPPSPPPSPEVAATPDVTGTEAVPPEQVASRAPVLDTPLTIGQTVSVPFADGAVALPDAARSSLDRVVAALTGDARAKATVRAYAAGDGDPNQARRTSLSRALAVRAYLIDQGVESARIDVRALGDQFGGGAPERVDVVTSER